ECGVGGQALHLHGPLDRFTLAFHLKAALALGHRDHAQVDLRSQPAIQPYLLSAKMLPLIQGREIKETQVDRFLDLVRIGAGEKHDRDVSLADLEFRDRKGICSSIRERTDELDKFHGTMTCASDATQA